MNNHPTPAAPDHAAHRRARSTLPLKGRVADYSSSPPILISGRLRLALLLASISLFLAGADVCRAGDIKTGRAKAMMCQACHGLDGLSKVPDAPNIAGQTEPYLVAQLQAFKTGARKNDAMTVVATSLSDADIEDLAAYYSAIEINLGKIPGQ
jgi:cytochrome c553